MTRFPIVVAVLLLAGCVTSMPADTMSAALQAIDDLRASGAITLEQWQAMRDAIVAAGSQTWWFEAAQTLGAAALGYFGVQLKRGPAATPGEREMRKAARKANAKPQP